MRTNQHRSCARESFSYIFNNHVQLNRILIGTLVLIISSLLFDHPDAAVLGYFIIMGYALEVLRNVRHGNVRLSPLPEWNKSGSAGVKTDSRLARLGPSLPSSSAPPSSLPP